MLLTMASPKVKMVNVRLRPEIHDAFKIACDLRGVSMSSLMHQFIVRTIREEREAEPQAFANIAKPVNGIPVAPTGSTIKYQGAERKRKHAR